MNPPTDHAQLEDEKAALRPDLFGPGAATGSIAGMVAAAMAIGMRTNAWRSRLLATDS